MTPSSQTRRQFLATTGLATAAFSAPHIARAQDSPGPKIRVGIVGCGGRLDPVADMALRDGRFEITALADYFQEMVDQKGEKYEVPENRRHTGLEGYRKMIEAGGIDVIAILTPPYFHPEQCEAAVDAGLHVWLAKPIAVDAQGTARIEAAAAKAAAKERIFFVDFQTRALGQFNEAARRSPMATSANSATAKSRAHASHSANASRTMARKACSAIGSNGGHSAARHPSNSASTRSTWPAS